MICFISRQGLYFKNSQYSKTRRLAPNQTPSSKIQDKKPPIAVGDQHRQQLKYMSKILITGGAGFVAPYLKKTLGSQEVTLTDLVGRGIIECDLTDPAQANSLIRKVRPDEVYHLAAISSPKNEDRAKVMKINVGGTLNLLRAIKKFSPQAKVLLVSTGYVYGNCQKAAESDRPNAREPYAQSKLKMEQEALGKFPELKIYIARAFNHSGSGQQLGFFFPDLAKKINEAKKSGSKTIEVINPDSARDFMHVKDTVAAYKLILAKGRAGEIYNVATGKKYKIIDLVARMLKAADLKNTKISRKEKKGVMSLVGSNERLKRLGFKPKHSIDDVISDQIKG